MDRRQFLRGIPSVALAGAMLVRDPLLLEASEAPPEVASGQIWTPPDRVLLRADSVQAAAMTLDVDDWEMKITTGPRQRDGPFDAQITSALLNPVETTMQMKGRLRNVSMLTEPMRLVNDPSYRVKLMLVVEPRTEPKGMHFRLT